MEQHVSNAKTLLIGLGSVKKILQIDAQVEPHLSDPPAFKYQCSTLSSSLLSPALISRTIISTVTELDKLVESRATAKPSTSKLMSNPPPILRKMHRCLSLWFLKIWECNQDLRIGGEVS